MDAFQANQALDRADGLSALAGFTQLEQADPAEGDWARGSADACRLLGDRVGELDALGRAADCYQASGRSLDGVVMLKRILDLDPTRAAAKRHLGALFGPSSGVIQDVGRPTDDLPRDQPVSIARLSLTSVAKEGVFEIPVFGDDELSDAFEAIEEQPKSVNRPTQFPLSPFFAAVSEDAFAELLAELRIFSAKAGTKLFSQGDVGHSFFIITKGSVAVFREGDERLRLAELHAGELFGEIALLTNQPRSATVEVLQDAEMIEVNRGSMSRLVFEDEGVMPVLLWFLRERLVDTLVRTSPIFSVVPPAERRALASAFSFIEVREQTVLIDQGQSPRGVIVALAGNASVVRTFGEETIELGMLGAGDVCGEMSLLTHEPALATVVAEPGFVGLELAKKDVEILIAARPALLKMLAKIAEERRVAFVDMVEGGAVTDTRLPLV